MFYNMAKIFVFLYFCLGFAMQDSLFPIKPGAITLNGFLGPKIDSSINNRLKKQDYTHLVDPFRTRQETSGWQCEFWGKVLRSVQLSYLYNQDTVLKSIMDSAVYDLLSTQTAEGYIGTYMDGYHLQGWDVWGRKYVLLALERYYAINPDSTVLQAMIREADFLMTEVGPDKTNIEQTGQQVGMASSSILEPMVLLYNLTGFQRYLDFSEYIVSRGGTSAGNIFEDALNNVNAKDMGNGKAYEMMSVFEGLTELYRVTGNPEYREAVLNFYNNICNTEIMVVGGSSCEGPYNNSGYGEYWNNGAVEQVNRPTKMMETCVTVTWMKLCYQVLRLTGDPTVVEEIEKSVYNSLLGAMVPDGSWWSHYNPLNGEYRSPASGQCSFGLDCCVANGPMAMALIPFVAVMNSLDGPVVNLYNAGTAKVLLDSSREVLLQFQTDYPADGRVGINVQIAEPDQFTLRLRIPAWSKQTVLTVQGDTLSAVSGTYAAISRVWNNGDQIELSFDMRARLIRASGDSNNLAITRGPLVLSRDSRYGGAPVELNQESDIVPLDIVPPSLPGIYLEAILPNGSRLCDYQSSGNTWNTSSNVTVWFPVFLNDTLWQTVQSVTDGTGGTERFDVSAEGRFVRMLGLQRGTQWGFGLYEFEIYSGGVNIATGKPVTVSSYYVESRDLRGPRAVDGDHTTFWSSIFTEPQFIRVDLGEDVYIDSIVLVWEAAYGKAYKLQIMKDTATTAADLNGATTVHRPVEVDICPNPFNPQIEISYRVPGNNTTNARVRMEVFNTNGTLVRILMDGRVSSGCHSVRWDAAHWPSGVYVLKYTIEGMKGVKLLTLLK